MCQIVLNNNLYRLMAFIAQNNLAKIYMKAFWYALYTAGCHDKMGYFKPLQLNEILSMFDFEQDFRFKHSSGFLLH